MAKLVLQRLTDEPALRGRAELLLQLSAAPAVVPPADPAAPAIPADPALLVGPAIVAPLVVDGKLVNPLGEWLAVCFPFIDGRPPDPTSAFEAELMGRTLAGLHRHLAMVPTDGLRPVRVLTIPELRSQPAHRMLGTRPTQLLHGDYAPANLVLAPDGLHILDFDDCGLGPVELELGNTLFMTLFDFTVDDRGPGPHHRYRTFRHRLISSYVSHAGRPVDTELLDAAVELRRSALRHWLDRPAQAPPGIRDADPTWRRVLERFVRSGPPGG